MLASTVQFSKYGRTRHHTHREPTTTPATSRSVMMTANHTKGNTHHNSGHLFPQDPTVCRATDPTTGDPNASVPPT